MNLSSFVKNNILQKFFKAILPETKSGYSIYVGNLLWTTTEDDLLRAFSPYGKVIKVTIITNKVTNKPKGFGFVTYANKSSISEAIIKMNQRVYGGRTIKVSRADDNYQWRGRRDLNARSPQ